MTKREKILGISFLIVIVIIAHILIAFYIKSCRERQLAEINEFNAKIMTYSMMDGTAKVIKKEISWIDQHTPPVISFQNAQTDLENFLGSSSKSLGFSAFTKKLIQPDPPSSIYQRVRIQMSARATEKQIYQWLVKIHQPKKMRILTYVKLSPPVNDSNLISCEIIAEQYIIAE